MACFKILLSKALGYSIILGSILVKVPQIMKILKNQSAEGLSMFAVILELCGITFMLAYSFVKQFPFSAYGDGAFLAIQTAVIGSLILHYQGSTGKVLAFCLSYLSFCYILMSGLTPMNVLWSLQASIIPIIVVSKMTQALTNYRNQSTGQLSAVTCFMMFFGAVARVFTSIQETGDMMMILTYCVSTSANGLIAGQLLYYWNSDKTKIKKSE